MEKRSDYLRRRLQTSDVRCWNSFNREKDPFAGISDVPLFSGNLKTLRPWDPKPSEHYKEMLRLKNYWYDHPPGVTSILGFLAALVILNLTVALLPVLVNYDLFYGLWRDLRKPSYVYEGGSAIVFIWALAHITSSLAAWFVYLSGGWIANRVHFISYFAMLASEAMMADLMFGARRLDYTTFCALSCSVTCLVSVFMLGSVARLSAACLVPLLSIYLFITVLVSDMWNLNGYQYDPVV
eukprot:TRINITY_DN17967_c0_g1_i1.p1 TRINITY_DN17967_c0_g1~~TRINITY_DN17967_c0_g1_i1.p1  ORF type:complete len:263 (+),score=20.98 TRINITY_DN17967_c0_g1_i1:75-791(+)